MNRRLFVNQIIAQASLLTLSSSLIACPVFLESDPFYTTDTLKGATKWVKNGSLGPLQHVALSHVYSPEHTSLAALKGMIQDDMDKVNALLGTNFSITGQALPALASSEYGSHSIQCEQNGIKLIWQGLARIGGETRKPATRLSLLGSKGAIQATPGGSDYQFVDFQGRVSHFSV